MSGRRLTKRPPQLEIVGIRELARRTRELVEEAERNRQPILVTRRGRPAVVFYPVDEDDLEDFVLANAPEFVRSMAEADHELAQGETTPWDEVRGRFVNGEGTRSGGNAVSRGRPRKTRTA